MPPPQGTWNPIEGPGDYTFVPTLHNDTYPAISPLKADLAGQAVLVTGASRGLGRAMAVSFARAGASFLALGARSPDALAETAALARREAAAGRRPGSEPPQILELQLDVADERSVAGAADRIRAEVGRLDILVHNAGILSRSTIVESGDNTTTSNNNNANNNKDKDETSTDTHGSLASWWDPLRVNLGGVYLVSRAMVPLMLASPAGRRTVVAVSSVGALCSTPGLSAYQVSKLATSRLLEHLAAENPGLLTYSIHPGNIPTDVVGGIEGLAPALRPVFTETPELSADSLVYLTSQRREWLCGRYINVTWDLPEVMAKQDEIVKGNKLKISLIL